MGHMQEIIHPDDYPSVRPRLSSTFTQKNDSIMKSLIALDIVLVIGSGLRDNGRVVAWDEKGKPFTLDWYTPRYYPEREIEAKLRLSASVFEHAAEGIYILDESFCFYRLILVLVKCSALIARIRRQNIIDYVVENIWSSPSNLCKYLKPT